ncbi:hypothetical protein KCP70_20795 [Salmonella enterica subsp. enterica]|nr:hypothetical protein KCP70_20795 [Salmonella enterica subsp. enterica]
MQTRRYASAHVQSGRRQNPGLTHSAADHLRQRVARFTAIAKLPTSSEPTGVPETF